MNQPLNRAQKWISQSRARGSRTHIDPAMIKVRFTQCPVTLLSLNEVKVDLR